MRAYLQYSQTNRFQGADSLDAIRNHLLFPQIGRSEKICNIRIDQKPREPVMGIEPMTPVLPRLCATAAPHGRAFWVGSEGFEPPKSETADLQSAPFGHFGNCPG